jgi:transposase
MTRTNDPVHVITSVERRRRWSPAEKKAIVEETYQPGMSVSAVARKYGIFPTQLFQWRRVMESGALSAVGSGEEVVVASEFKMMEKRVRELERMLGRATLENQILRDAVKLAQKKKLISRQPLPGVESME